MKGITEVKAKIASLAEKMMRAMPWAMPLKLIFGAILGALGSAGLLGYLSELATYSYSIHYGIRPPVEGIPYLRAAVTYGSFFLLLSAALIFGSSVALIKIIIRELDNTLQSLRDIIGIVVEPPQIAFSESMTEMLSKRSKKQVLFMSVAVAAFCASTTYITITIMEMVLGTGSPPTMILTFLSGCYGFVTTIAISRKGAIWWMAAAATIAYFMIWLIVLFSPTKYSHFLRMVGHGGGILVTMELRDPGHRSCFSRQNYYLMIRSTDAIIVYSDSDRRIIEIPRDQVRSISHDSGRLLHLPYNLPE
jgi:hypothetical protein